jgi:hypothetical protein
VIAFFRRSDLIDLYPNGVIGTEVDHGPPCTIVGPLSPLLEEEMHNNNTNTGGDEAKTLYENGGESPSNQVSSEDEGAITNIDSLRTFTMKRHYLPILMTTMIPSPPATIMSMKHYRLLTHWMLRQRTTTNRHHYYAEA